MCIHIYLNENIKNIVEKCKKITPYCCKVERYMYNKPTYDNGDRGK